MERVYQAEAAQESLARAVARIESLVTKPPPKLLAATVRAALDAARAEGTLEGVETEGLSTEVTVRNRK